MSLIAEVGSGARNAGSGTALSVTHGLTILAGDVIVAMMSVNAAANTLSDNNGSYPFTEAYQADHVGSGATAHYAIFRRVAGASEPVSYAFTAAGSYEWALQVRVFRNVDNTTPFEVTPSASTDVGSSSDGTSATSTDITTSNTNALGILMAVSDASSGVTFSSPGNGYGNELEQGGGVWPIASYTKQLPTAGAVGTVGLTLDASNDWTLNHFALRAATTPSFVDENHQSWGYVSAGKDVVNLPSNTVAGDLIVVLAVYDGTQASLALTGFTKIVDDQSLTNGTYRTTHWCKVATGSEGATATITGWSGDPPTSNLAAAWRNVPTTHNVSSLLKGPTDGSYTATFNSVTFTYSGGLDILWYWDSSGYGPFSSWSVGTERYDDSFETFADRFDVSSGSTGTATMTTTSQQWGASGTVRHAFSDVPPFTWRDHDGVKPWASIWRSGRV